MPERMRILLSNDDGAFAPGLQALYDALRPLGHELIVAAPESEQSAASHSITIAEPLRVRPYQGERGMTGYAVRGTPADCVKLALSVLLDQPPDLVVSGVNQGPNTGISVIYSGTVAAAAEGTLNRIPSVALSIDAFENPHWESCGTVARKVVEFVGGRGLPEGVLLNVNIPNLAPEKIRGFSVTTTALSRFIEIFHKRKRPRGGSYYWLDGELQITGKEQGTDVEALAQGYISLAPLHFDITAHAALDILRPLQDEDISGRNR